jgi:hypothetical protein
MNTQGPPGTVTPGDDLDEALIVARREARSFYLWGSDNSVSLFFRPKGTLVERAGRDGYTSREDVWIIQWGGAPDYDSGYAAYGFQEKSRAVAKFKAMAEDEFRNR